MLQSMDNGEFYLIDLGSRNGTFLNGRRVSIPVILHGGDRLAFGDSEMEFYCPLRRSDDSVSETWQQSNAATAVLHVRRLITVLVADIRGFTILTRQTDEKVLSEAIGTWFRQAGDIIRYYGSWVDKYIGDAIMAVWIHGVEEVSPAEVLSVFRAVDALQIMTAELHLRYALPFPLKIGTGLNTGHAMVGNTGSSDRPDYTALGDTVNAAFRLESCTKDLQLDVALGTKTYEYWQTIPGADQAAFKAYEVQLKGYEGTAIAHATTYAQLHAFLVELHRESESIPESQA